jgi:hypothetical protein
MLAATLAAFRLNRPRIADTLSASGAALAGEAEALTFGAFSRSSRLVAATRSTP